MELVVFALVVILIDLLAMARGVDSTPRMPDGYGPHGL